MTEIEIEYKIIYRIKYPEQEDRPDWGSCTLESGIRYRFIESGADTWSDYLGT